MPSDLDPHAEAAGHFADLGTDYSDEFIWSPGALTRLSRVLAGLGVPASAGYSALVAFDRRPFQCEPVEPERVAAYRLHLHLNLRRYRWWCGGCPASPLVRASVLPFHWFAALSLVGVVHDVTSANWHLVEYGTAAAALEAAAHAYGSMSAHDRSKVRAEFTAAGHLPGKGVVQ